ncbi:MAG TPA: multiheme c-type cytochrome, partial [Tepidisphaeraceae bacterium]|nr:multiheme c-type cytochrome [Tepidisphaeraceae bacterium]
MFNSNDNSGLGTGRSQLHFLSIILFQLSLVVALVLVGCSSDSTPVSKVHDSDQTAVTASAISSSSDSQSPSSSAADPSGDAAHARLYAASRFPSATACGQCHPTEYRQWSISQHAYAQMSPIFNAMQGKIIKGTNGTNGDFCIHCHTQVGMNLGESQFESNIDRNPTSREGISCVICHRMNQAYGKISGRFSLVEADLTKPVYGPTGNNEELKKAIDNQGLVTTSDKAGRQVHAKVEKFFQLTTSTFCGTCHDVNLLNGFRLEEAYSEYKHSPAALRGTQCQDCHMGKEPGKVVVERSDPDFFKKNYAWGPAAKVGSFETAPRMLTNHKFIGPDYSVLPPSLFPLNIAAIKEESEKKDPKARGLATIREWITFDWKAGWGTDAFEDKVSPDYKFPP